MFAVIGGSGFEKFEEFEVVEKFRNKIFVNL